MLAKKTSLTIFLIFYDSISSLRTYQICTPTPPPPTTTTITQLLSVSLSPRSGELRTQKLKSHLVRTQSLNVLPLKPGVCQYIAIHARLTARDFSLAYFYLSDPFASIFFQNLSRFFPVLAVANTWFLCRSAE